MPRLFNENAEQARIYSAPERPLLVNGLGFADALSAGPLAAEGTSLDGSAGSASLPRQPVLLTSPFELSRATATYNATTIENFLPIGGQAAVPDARAADAYALLEN